MPLSTFQIIQASNDPTGSSYMDSTAGTTYLVNELTDIKATVRSQSLTKPWISLVGLSGAGWAGSLAWTFVSTTSASIPGDQTVATGTGYLTVKQRVRALVTAGTIYGQISAVSQSAGVTTVTFIWDAGVLDAGLTDIQTGGDLNGIPNNVVTQTQAPVYATISNVGAVWTGALSPVIAAYLTGQEYRVKWGAASQGSDTVNLNAIGAVTVKKNVNGALVNLAAADLPSGAVTNLLYDGTNFQVSAIGTATTGAVLVFDRLLGNPAATVTNTVTPTDLYSKSVPGGTLGTDGWLEIEFGGTFLNNSGSNTTFQLALTYGATTFASTGASFTVTPTATAYQFEGKLRLYAAGATNAQFAAGELVMGGSALPTGSSTWRQNTSYGGILLGGAIDSTAAQNLKLTVTHGNAAVTITTTLYELVVKQVLP